MSGKTSFNCRFICYFNSYNNNVCELQAMFIAKQPDKVKFKIMTVHFQPFLHVKTTLI